MLIIKLSVLLIFLCVASCNLNQMWVAPVLQNNEYSYITRTEWNASFPENVAPVSDERISQIILKYTDTHKCINKRMCSRFVKLMQHEHINEGYNDIQYNFLFDPHGNIYEGLGFMRQKMFDTAHYSITIGFFGRVNSTLTPNQKYSLEYFLRGSFMQKILTRNYVLDGPEFLLKPAEKIHKNLYIDMCKT